MSSRPAIRVLYVGGWGRSGSTLLDRMLGQVPGFAALGEIREIWQSGLTEDRQCGCGLPFRQCPFWSEVGERAFGGWDRVDLPSALGLWKRYDRPWALPSLLTRRSANGGSPGLGRYVDLLGRLYAAIAETSGAEVVVDSSKLPSHALLVRMIPGVDVRLVHLVRDSRGVAYSWRKRVLDPGAERLGLEMEHYTPATSSLRWLLYNEATSLCRPAGLSTLVMRYEDLVADPQRSLGRAVGHAGVDAGGGLDFVEGREMTLRRNHNVDGNPIRFVEGPLTVRPDEEWLERLGRGDRALVTALTAPGLAQYGYPLRRPARREAHRPAVEGTVP